MNITYGIKASLFLAVVLLSGCASTTLPTQADPANEGETVRKVLHAYVDGRQARDLAEVEAMLDPDVDQLTSRGEWRRGRETAMDGMRRSTTRNPGDRTLIVETVRFLHPDVALADARYIIKGTKGTDRVLWSSFTLVKGPDEKWRITSIRNQKPAQ